MSFELLVPRTVGYSIRRGVCAIDKNLNCRFHIDDLTAVDLDGTEVALLIDRATQRIAFRRPMAGELVRKLKRSKRGGGGSTNLGGACRELGLDEASVGGPHELLVKDNLLIVNLGNMAADDDADDPDDDQM